LAKIDHPKIVLVAPPGRMFSGAMRRGGLATIFWVAVVCWAATILWLSSRSHDDLPRLAFLFSDKLNHFVAFGAGGWLTLNALRLTRPDWSVRTAFVSAVILVALFAAFDELFQLLSPGRTGADLYDWIADFLGAATGALFSLLTYARLERLVTRR